MTELRYGERIDDLQRNGCRIIQNPALFCFGMDAVLLASFAEQGKGTARRTLDLCSGNGVVPILMDARSNGESGTYTGLEINPVNVDMASRSAQLNGQQERIHFIEGDVRECSSFIAAASCDAVTVNPPYMIGGHGIVSDDSARMIARHEILCTLDDVIGASARVLKPFGRLFMVHRPFRLADIFRSLNEHALEPKRMRMVYPFADKEANMVLIEAVRGGKSRMAVEAPLVIYQRDGVYTDEVRRLYG